MVKISVFLCGAVDMVIGLTGSRVLAPYLGTSLVVWASLIGIIRASLSLGYWWGGRVVDRRPEALLLGRMITAPWIVTSCRHSGIERTSHMKRFLRYAFSVLSLALIPGCAQLPEYARPRMVEVDELQKTLATGFAYRELTPEDFRAASLSEQLAEHAERINAHAATHVRLTADSSFRITSGDLYGQSYFFGRIERLGFEAVMLPDQSWWNPKMPPNMRGYVLQHEQIHFALTEIAARQLTIDSRQWASEVLVIKSTPQEVRAELARQIKERINAAMEASLKRQAEFDDDTSLFFNPRRQQGWSRTVEDELKRPGY